VTSIQSKQDAERMTSWISIMVSTGRMQAAAAKEALRAVTLWHAVHRRMDKELIANVRALWKVYTKLNATYHSALADLYQRADVDEEERVAGIEERTRERLEPLLAERATLREQALPLLAAEGDDD
jgi:hypothetical protein